MYTTDTLDADLLRVYTREDLFEPCEREERRFWDDIQESTDHRPGGKGRFFRIIGASGHSVGNPAEAGDMSEHNTRLEVECFVEGAQIDSVTEFSMWLEESQKEGGAYAMDADNEKVVECTQNLYSYASTLMGVGHATGRLAVIGANATATDVITLSMSVANPEGGFQLRPNMRVDIVDTDTGGTVQEANVLIEDLDPVGPTPTVTFDRNVTVTAGWGIYMRNVYGNTMPNGLRNIVSDGDFGSSIFNVTRTGNPYLNAHVDDGGGGLRDYELNLVRKFIGRIMLNQDKYIPTQLRCNEGIVNEHLKRVTADVLYNVDNTSSENPRFPTGANQEKQFFQYGDKKIPFRIDHNLPARSLYALHMPSWRRHTLRKADWVRGPGGKMFHLIPSDGGGRYKYAVIGSQMMNMNISCKRLNGQGAMLNLNDEFCAGDGA